MNTYTIHYNRTTNHINGFAIASTSEYTMNTCGSITRSSLAKGQSFGTAAEALESAKKNGRRVCKNCEAAALKQIALDEAAAAEAETVTEVEATEAPAVTAIVLPALVTMNTTTRVLSGPVRHLRALMNSGAAIITEDGDLVLI